VLVSASENIRSLLEGQQAGVISTYLKDSVFKNSNFWCWIETLFLHLSVLLHDYKDIIL
jgi:hypothetical protein